MSHIPHYGTPGYSSNPTSSHSQSPLSLSRGHQSPLVRGDYSQSNGNQSPHTQYKAHQSPTQSRGNQSPLSVSLRRNLPVQNPPDSPLLKPATPQDSPSLKSVNGHPGNKIKCVFIGDGAVGKTSLIISYTTNGYPSEYVPTAIDTYHATVHVDGQPLTLELCDTPGQDDFDTLRPLVYPHTDVFLLCFSVVMPSTLQNVKEKWIPEIRAQSKKVPIVLVGTQSDLREDAKTLVGLRNFKEQPIHEAEARKAAASLGCETYVESSSLTQKNLKEVFDNAIVEGLRSRNVREQKKLKNKKKKKCSIL
eukprot:GFUD01033239.1.p1 GENE.GFUD01033239.1~~GFUD01033239.1.p1  ORF type:complete len:306 (+),score=80.28 GFUD01033239.1:150-1067(+)